MTDFDAATAWHKVKAAAAAMCFTAATIGLAGCETAGNIFGDQTASQAVANQPPAAPVAPQLAATFALAPIIGAPEATATQLRGQLEQAAAQNRIGMLPDRDAKANFGLRGYIVAARDKGAVKVSYIWDVTDTSGQRVNRITGEEAGAMAPGSTDPWSAVTPQLTQSIANKVASSLGAWAPGQVKGTPVASAPAGQASGAGAGALAPTPVAAAPASPGATNTTTAALPPAAPVVPTVVGAPGDGNAALATALQRELQRQGVSLGGASGGYRVEGKVALGAVKDGKQSIQIDWRVKDASGAAVGTVTQKNAIPPGSLDGAWGKTADAAAAAAAQGIIKLLPQQARASSG